MENKNNNVWLLSLIFLIAGLVGGWLIAGSNNPSLVQTGMHMMPNGQLMSNNGSSGMAQMMIDMNVGLIGKNGDEFDKAFLSEMIVHHEGAVQMAQLALKNAKHQEIKDLANAIIIAQTNEIAQMKEWEKSWYNLSN